MKKTKVVLFILLFALVIGVCTYVRAYSIVDDSGGTHFLGEYTEFLQLSEEERNSINVLEFNGVNEEETMISFKDMHLESLKSLNELIIRRNFEIKDEEYEEMPNIKEIIVNDFSDVEGLIKGMKNLESIYIGNGEIDFEFDYSILKNFIKLKDLHINDKKMTDIGQLPEIDTLTALSINVGEEVELNNFKEIGNNFKNLKFISLPNNLEIPYDDLMYVSSNCENFSAINCESEVTFFKDCGTVTQGKEIKINTPYSVIRSKAENVKTNNCTFKMNDNYNGMSDFGKITINTSNLGENEATAYFTSNSDTVSDIEIKVKYTVVEPVVKEPEVEESKPDKEEVNPSTTEEEPITGTGEDKISGGFLSKIIDTIKNLINSIIEKITNLFKFKF